MKGFVFVTVALVAGLTFAEGAPAAPKASKRSPEERRARLEAAMLEDMKAFGGYCQVPGTPQGKIRIANAQKRVPAADLAPIRKELAHHLRYDAEIVPSAPVTMEGAVAAHQAIGAEIVVFIIDDPKTAPLLISPEEHWAIVNVAKLVADNPAPAFAASRTRKEVMRALGYMTAASSNAAQLLDPIKTIPDLDKIGSERFPADVLVRQRKYLSLMGLKVRSEDTYLNLISRGYNIPPTNEYQKAFWDQVHATPSAPIKIKKTK